MLYEGIYFCSRVYVSYIKSISRVTDADIQWIFLLRLKFYLRTSCYGVSVLPDIFYTGILIAKLPRDSPLIVIGSMRWSDARKDGECDSSNVWQTKYINPMMIAIDVKLIFPKKKAFLYLTTQTIRIALSEKAIRYVYLVYMLHLRYSRHLVLKVHFVRDCQY